MGALVGRVMWGERLHMAHAKMEDPRVRGHRLVYVSQALGAAVVVLAVLVVEDAVTNAAVVAAIASTAFVLFVTPHSVVAQPRHVVGGHVLCCLTGSAIAVVLGTGAGESAIAEVGLIFELGAATAVGVAMLLMGLTDTEHPPAAGTALGFAIVDFSVELVAVLLVSVVFMVVAQQLVLARLRTLL